MTLSLSEVCAPLAPLTAVEQPPFAAAAAAAAAPPAPAAPRPRSLLLVDDEAHVLAALRRSLRRNGYAIVTALSAAEGLAYLAQAEVDVIVSDQRMPGMTGVEFLRRAKVLYPQTVRIVLSGYTELQSITDAINEGAIYKFLTKPWEDDLLSANIEEAFRQKELADENRRLDREVRLANAELAEVNRRLEAVLAARNASLSLMEDHGHGALALLHQVPAPLIGLDAEGLIAFVNQEALALLPALAGWMGHEACEVLPEGWRPALAAEDGERVSVSGAGICLQGRCRTLAGPDGPRGRLLLLLPGDAQ